MWRSLLIGNLRHQGSNTKAPPKTHSVKPLMRWEFWCQHSAYSGFVQSCGLLFCLCLDLQWGTETVHSLMGSSMEKKKDKIGIWDSTTKHKLPSSITSMAHWSNATTYKIFIPQLGTLNNLQNTQIQPPTLQVVCFCSSSQTSFFCFSSVTMWHLGAALSQSQSSADVRHISDTPSSPATQCLLRSSFASGCRPITGSRASEPSCSAFSPYFITPQAFNPAQAQIFPWGNTNSSQGIKMKVLLQSVTGNKHLCTLFPRQRFPLRPLPSLRHNVWVTHRFVARKTAFQRVTINNSLVTNCADIYTWLGVFLRRAGGQ